MTQEEIKKRIEMYGTIINDPDEDQGTKDLAKKKVEKLKSQLEEVVVVEETVEEEVEEKVEKKPAKKTTKAKGRGRPKKRGRPAKRKRTAKAPTSKQKATKLSKAIGLSEEECRELLEKYDSEDKARKKRLSKRKKAGKSAELTVTESLGKEAKVVKNKLEDKKTPTSKSQAKAQGSRITALVKAILEGIDGKRDKVKQIDAIISQLEAEKKRIQSQKGVGGFLFGSALGGYTGYKVGTLQEKRKVQDLFKTEKKLAKDFKNAMKEQKKKKKEEEKFEYAEFEEMKRGGKAQGYDDKQDESLGMRTGKESSKKQNKKARREDSYGKWGKRGKEDRDISMAHRGTTYDKEQDELIDDNRTKLVDQRDDLSLHDERIDENQRMSEEGVELGDSAWGEFEPRLDQIEDRLERNKIYKKGGKSQGYDDKEDESLGMRTGKESTKKQSMKARREDSYGKWGKRDEERRRKEMIDYIVWAEENISGHLHSALSDEIRTKDWSEGLRKLDDNQIQSMYSDILLETRYKKGGTTEGLTGEQRDRMADEILLAETSMSDNMFQAIDEEVNGDWDYGLYRLSDKQLNKIHKDIREDRGTSYRE